MHFGLAYQAHRIAHHKKINRNRIKKGDEERLGCKIHRFMREFLK
jgi:hypothetical protein